MLRVGSRMTGKLPSRRTGLFVSLIALLLVIQLSWILAPKALALPLTERRLVLGDVNPGATTTHTFSFSFASAADVGSIRLEYCTSPLPDLPCDAPPGLDASGAALISQSGEADFTILDATTNTIILTRTPAAPVNNASTYVFDPVVNPTGAPDAFYVRITTHQSTDATDAFIDYGAVVNATTQAIRLSTEVPPILKFCVGLTIATDCSSADGNLIDLGDLSAIRASSGSSQLLAATNAEFGLAVAAYGTTLTSGNNEIRALDVPTPSAPGNAQFGINLRDNSDPDVGGEPDGVGLVVPTARYDTPNRYAFKAGDVVATSPDATDVRKLTASYVVNVPPSQPPGVYTATITYICTATF